MWKDKDGYLIKSYYLGGGKNKKVRVHREIMEKHLGRKLLDTEIVHHKDGNKENNSIENLELFFSHKDHKNSRHRVVSDGTRRKLSLMRKGKKKSEEHARKLREHLANVRPSGEKLLDTLARARSNRRELKRDSLGRFVKLP